MAPSGLQVRHRTQAQGLLVLAGQVLLDGQAGQGPQPQAEILQYSIQPGAVELAEIENEFWPSGHPHDALDLGSELVGLRQLQIVVLDPEELRARLAQRDEKRDRIPG